MYSIDHFNLTTKTKRIIKAGRMVKKRGLTVIRLNHATTYLIFLAFHPIFLSIIILCDKLKIIKAALTKKQRRIMMTIKNTQPGNLIKNFVSIIAPVAAGACRGLFYEEKEPQELQKFVKKQRLNKCKSKCHK